jgi:exopolysaccharide biosynthesis polyprenyl glycosylphosphotransferase
MFKFNRIFFIISNFIISYFIFIFIFLSRYRFFDLSGIDKRNLTPDVMILLAFYSAVIIILNISFKVYEVNKISRLVESILINVFISIVSIGVIGSYFYFTQTNFARFVFFSGFILIPVILSVYNKVMFFLIIKKAPPVKILFYGNRDNFILFRDLIEEFKKWFPIEATRIYIDEDLSLLRDELNKYDLMVVDSDQKYSKEQFEIINTYEVEGGRIYSLVDIFAYFDQSLPAEIIRNQHFELFSSYKLDSIYNRFIKRLGDIFISLSLLILTSPVFLLTALSIKLTSKGGVFYLQDRVGLKGREFKVLKFRSMVSDAEAGTAMLTKKNDSRITPVGRIIRPLRIDELPQLLNILKGEMSLIGPRPERKEFIDRIIKDVPLFKKRLLVKPGLTGWAQVKYTYVNELDMMDKKLSYDLYYINNLSFIFDIKIIFYTVETIVYRRGAL